MGKTDALNNENILVKVDQNNLIYIDPNSVVDDNGNIAPRGLNQENLVMYVNLEADIVPRSILVAENDKNTLTSIARGTLNFMRNQNGGDFDSSWTDTYVNQPRKNEVTKEIIDDYENNDSTGQSFGIDSIQISIKGGNSIPQVNIMFIDVRGKTLFESAENSPYQAFFHIPWPIFYLTVKGFYGKAIRYRLHLVKFSSRYNDSNGNFEVSTSFVGSTYAFLNDIPLKGMLNCPYMFAIDNTVDKNSSTKTDTTKRTISKSSKGYSILSSVYSEMKQKQLIPEDFPVKTLREVITLAQGLDKLLEDQISSQILDANIFVGMKDYEERVVRFKESVIAWANTNLLSTFVEENNILYYEIKGSDKTKGDIITGATSQGTLEFIIEKYRKELEESTLFTKEILKNNTNTNFSKQNLLSKTTGKIDAYFRQNKDKQYQVKIDSLVSDVDSILNTFTQQKDKMEQVLETEMNKIVQDKTKGFGFEPTIRNIFAVLLANAEVYIRLMKDTHIKAFEQSSTRKQRLQGFTEETKGKDAIYPWPEIKKNAGGQKQKVIAYPGEPELVSKLGSDNKILWPEVDFVENFIETSTNKSDPNAEKENGVNKLNIVFEGDLDENKITKISSLSALTNRLPYIDKSPSSFLYEIWERAYYFTLFDSFDDATINELAKIEFENIKESIKEDIDVVSLLKTKVTSSTDLRDLLKSYSPFERYPYYQDQLATTPYIKDIVQNSFSIEQYNISNEPKKSIDFKGLNNFLLDYKPESYRKNIYPFNSTTYLSYLNKTEFTDEELKFKGNLSVNLTDGFISTPINTYTWVKKGRKKNIFKEKLTVGDNKVNILNTPYFHQQLYSDFTKIGTNSKYVGSAYLLLNSLPFYDLEDEKDFLKTKTDPTGEIVATATKKVRISSLFREVGSTHFIPFHLIAKWGSIYHRYKKYVLDGVDIITGCTNAIDGNLFFNSGKTESVYTAFTVNGTGVTYSGNVDVGMHPYYDAVYHQILNNYNHYDIQSGNTSFSANVTLGAIVPRRRKLSNSLNYWTSFVDNSKYDSKDMRYTILPCDGDSNLVDKTFKLPLVLTAASPTTNELKLNTDTFQKGVQYYFRCIWEDEYINNDYTGKTFPSYNEYHRSYVTGTTRTNDNQYSMVTNYRKIIDLIGTFSPSILEEFEQIFLDFASEKINEDSSFVKKYDKVHYPKFQDLLKDLLSVEKKTTDSTNIETLISTIKQRQSDKLEFVSEQVLSVENLLKITIANPKEIDSHVFSGFAQLEIDDRVNTFRYNEYDVSQLTNLKYIKLYIGEDIDGYYEDFFTDLDIELSEENVLLFRPLVLIYAGYMKSGGVNSKTNFQTYIRENIFVYGTKNNVGSSSSRLTLFLNLLTREFTKLELTGEAPSIKIVSGYNNNDLKIELYNYFKSFNDKWTAGNSIGQRLLMEEFLFLDKANKDIGDKLYLNLDRLLPLGDTKNDKADLYSVISMIIQGTGLDMRAVPAYVNFYGTNFSNKTKITPSKKVAENIFGTFLEVDYQESSPKIIIQLVGPSSKHPETTSKKYKFADDSFNISNVNNNPLIITTPQVFNTGDLSKSNKVIAFEVSFGDQNQNIFKGVQLDQSTLKNTSESFVVLENLARSESGTGAYNVDIGLFDYYRQASYTCDVTCMGNVMIQPTMFFYLKNIPMFKGSYWITEVNHNIKNNSITTTFKGTRIPYASLPDPKDSFTSSYRVLVDRLRTNVIAKFKNQDANTTKTTITIKHTDGNIYLTDPGENVKGEDFLKNLVYKVGATDFGIPYNGALGEKNIQLVKYNGGEWLRARVVQMGGPKYPLSETIEFGVVSQLKNIEKLPWSEIKNTSNTTDFYSTKFKLIPPVTAEKITSGSTVTTFINPDPVNKVTVPIKYSLTGTKGSRIVTGPIGTGPIVDGYGVGMSRSLMLKLKLNDGDVVYFQVK